MSIYSRYFERIDHKAEFKAAQEELDKEKEVKKLHCVKNAYFK